MENYSASLIMEWATPLGVTVKSLTGWQVLRKEQSVDGDRMNEESTSLINFGFSI